MLPLCVVWQTRYQQWSSHHCSTVRAMRVDAIQSCNSQARFSGVLFFSGQRGCAPGKDEECLSISAGDNRAALSQCQRAAFLVQSCEDEATILIKNGGLAGQISSRESGSVKKSRTICQRRWRNLAEKKLFSANPGGREKLYTADGGGAAITYPPFLWITLCIR